MLHQQIKPSRQKPARFQLSMPGCDSATAVDDIYSDRVRCDHPAVRSGEALGKALIRATLDRGRGRIVALVPTGLKRGLRQCGFSLDAVMPGFYKGIEDCVVMTMCVDPSRMELANPKEVANVQTIIRESSQSGSRPAVKTRPAGIEDAGRIAALLGQTFAEYPTPSHDPAYIESQIRNGVQFRVIEENGVVVACASADPVPQAMTAELTDCATLPSHRGRGFMQSILSDLVEDLRKIGYPTAFTLARARIPGVNLAFHRLGFTLHGCASQFCRIGDGLEDINVWSCSLEPGVE